MQNPRPTLLIVDDEPTLRRALRTSLAASGFAVEEARRGEEAIEAFARSPFDLVLLDINMPGISGVETCRRLRALGSSAGIVMVTVRDAEEDMVRALEAGADDYVTKPYRFRELVARLRAVLRRTREDRKAGEPVMHCGDLEFDADRRILKRAGAEVHLSPTEFDLIAYFFKNRGKPLSHTQLLRAVWGPEYGGELEYLRSYVRMLRKKIEVDPARPAYIRTEPWLGYRFCDPADPDLPQPDEIDPP